jgi:hypothetical protein
LESLIELLKISQVLIAVYGIFLLLGRDDLLYCVIVVYNITFYMDVNLTNVGHTFVKGIVCNYHVKYQLKVYLLLLLNLVHRL